MKLCAIGIDNPKKAMGISSLWRSCYCFGVNFIFSVGTQIEDSGSLDTYIYLPKRVVDGIPFKHYESFDALKSVAKSVDAKLVAVEWPVSGKWINLKEYKHPERAIYLMGSESTGESKESWWVSECDDIVSLPTDKCLASASVGAIVLYDRYCKGG